MSLFRKKMKHQVTTGSCQDHLEVMRANFRDEPLTSKSLPKPLWIRLHRKDGLQVIYRDKDIVLQKGNIYYAYLLQANEMLFQKGNNLDLPGNIIFSTHPFAEEHPGFLRGIGDEITRFKGAPAEEIPEELREMAMILAAETDRSGVDLSVSIEDPEDPERMIEDIDIHFRSVIFFHKDLPDGVLRTEFLPVIAAPELTPAVLVLPEEYWTAPAYAL